MKGRQTGMSLLIAGIISNFFFHVKNISLAIFMLLLDCCYNDRLKCTYFKQFDLFITLLKLICEMKSCQGRKVLGGLLKMFLLKFYIMFFFQEICYIKSNLILLNFFKMFFFLFFIKILFLIIFYVHFYFNLILNFILQGQNDTYRDRSSTKNLKSRPKI